MRLPDEAKKKQMPGDKPVLLAAAPRAGARTARQTCNAFGVQLASA